MIQLILELKEVQKIIKESAKENYSRFKEGYLSSEDGSWSSFQNSNLQEIWTKHKFIFNGMCNRIEYLLSAGANKRAIVQQIIWEKFHYDEFFYTQMKKNLYLLFKAEVEKLRYEDTN